MHTERIKRWDKNKRLLTFLTGANINDPLTNAITEVQKKVENSSDIDAPKYTNSSLIESCKELVFDKKDGEPFFYGIMYTFDVTKGELSLGKLFETLFDGTKEEIEADILTTLAIAVSADVPVYPNTKDLEAELAHYHRKMLIEGFTAPDGKGNQVRLSLTRSNAHIIDSVKGLEKLNPLDSYSPSDLSLIKEGVLKELEKLKSADKILSSLSYAIDGFEKLLHSNKRNENALQAWLTENPILFGLEYQQIIPKHQLGSEYEMDYALKRHSGLVDLVEIEASTLPIYTKQEGNPSKELVHAEQQVMDWFEWIETNGSYARTNLPGLYTPKAFIVIGRNEQLTEANMAKLRRRNIIFKGQVEILTYDDLLDRAKNIRKIFQTLEKNI